jgi:hypothetical protein
MTRIDTRDLSAVHGGQQGPGFYVNPQAVTPQGDQELVPAGTWKCFASPAVTATTKDGTLARNKDGTILTGFTCLPLSAE